MSTPESQLVTDAKTIWQSGVDACAGDALVEQAVSIEEDVLQIGESSYELNSIGRIFVGGAGKASGWMARALEQQLESVLKTKQVAGWVNVPDNQVVPLESIRVFGARLPGSNVPESRTIDTSEDGIVLPIKELGPDDLCIFLVSGGGSALLEIPAKGLTLRDIRETTTGLSESGASIAELNTVRKCMSQVKGGGLARMCKARVATLVVSDVMSDQLDLVASGPMILDCPRDPAAAMEVLKKYPDARVSLKMPKFLEAQSTQAVPEPGDPSRVQHALLANNTTAVESAINTANELGYMCEHVACVDEGDVAEVASELAEKMVEMLSASEPVCFISGGEPTVDLGGNSGKGGRNQHLVLAACLELLKKKLPTRSFCLLSAGTDGEDGNVPVAGAWINDELLATIVDELPEGGEGTDRVGLEKHLSMFTSFTAFKSMGNLIKVPQTRTNVGDLRVLLTR